MARRFYSIDLSCTFPPHFITTHSTSCLCCVPANGIPHRGQVQIAEALRVGECLQLHALRLAQNPPVRSLVQFQQV